MKKITILSAALALTMSLTGCYDLDRYPTDKLSSGTYFKTEDHAKSAIVGVYSRLQNDNVFGLQFSMDCLGGIAMGYDNASYTNIQRGTYDVTNSQVSNKWSNLYESIARANIVLQNVDGCSMSDELKAQYKAEARFLRALFYNELLNFFGGVPIYDETTDVSKDFANMKNPRSTADQVRKFILDDLAVAYNGLPQSWGSADYGRATKYAARALEGKVYLYNKQYAEAKTCFEDVILHGGYSLYNDYAGLFLPGGDESNEMIFAVQNMGGVGTDFGMPMCFYMGTRASYGSCWNNVMVATTFADSYEWKDGRQFSWKEYFAGTELADYETNNATKAKFFNSTFKGSKVTTFTAYRDQIKQLYADRDPRMTATLITPYSDYLGWYKNAEAPSVLVLPVASIKDGNGYIRVNGGYNCYLWRKFVPAGDMNGSMNNRADTPINFPLIRYADVLLMMAECEWALNNDAVAIDYINQVRQRPSVMMPKLTWNGVDSPVNVKTHDEVFARLRHERAVEFAGEGLSFNDMKRWGLLETLNGKSENEITGKSRYKRAVSSRDYLWPIPSTEIEKNPDLTQNPGWAADTEE